VSYREHALHFGVDPNIEWASARTVLGALIRSQASK